MLQKYHPLWKVPEQPFYFNTALFGTSYTLDLVAEQYAAFGILDGDDWPENVTKSITGVDVYYENVTVGTGSTFHVSTQGVTGGDDVRPDNVDAQVFTADPSTLTAGVRSAHTFDVGRTVSKGQRISVVFRWSVFGSGSAVAVRSIASGVFNHDVGQCISSNSGTTWTGNGGGMPSIAFTCSDGSKIYFRGAGMEALTATTTNDFSSVSTGTGIDQGDERGMLWVPRRAYDLSGSTSFVRMTQLTSEADIVLYRDATVLQSRSLVSADNRDMSSAVRVDFLFDAPVRVNPGDNIRLVIKPTTLTVRWYRYAFSSAANIRKHWWGGDENEPDLRITNRVDGGAWNDPAGGDAAFTPCMLYGKRVALPGEHVRF